MSIFLTQSATTLNQNHNDKNFLKTNESKIFKTTWKPNMINDMIFWGDANSRNIKNDNGIYYWKDNSGKMNHGFQVTNKPTQQSNIINGYPAIYFDNNQSIKIRLKINYFTIFCVVKTEDNDYLYEFGNATNANDGFYLNGDANSLFINKSSLVSQKTNGYGWLTTDWQILTHKYNGTHDSSSLYKNNQFVNLSDYFDDDDPGDIDLDAYFNVGSNYDTDYGMKGYIAELIIFNRNLTIAEQTQVNNWLNYKYHIY